MKKMRFVVAILLGLFSSLSIAQEPFPHLGIQSLHGQLAKLGSALLIDQQLVFELQQPLVKSMEALQKADSKQAIQKLKVFKNKVSSQLASDIGDGLILQAGNIQQQITQIANRAISASTGACQLPAPDTYQSIRVGPGEAHSSIEAAMEYAAAQGYDAINIVLAPLAYRVGLIRIDRNTRFTAPSGTAHIIGGILNNGPFLLELNNIIVTGSAGTGIQVDHRCAVTILNNIEIQYAEGAGFKQQGGSLTVDGLTVVLSRAPDNPSFSERDIGRGVHLSGGITACMTDLSLNQNGAGALLAEGFDTRVFVSGLQATHNSSSSAVRDEIIETNEFTSGAGSIEVRDEATLLGEWMYVVSNDYAGIAAVNNARAHVRYSTFARTQAIPITLYSSLGGINILADSGDIELTTIRSSLSDIGLRINTRRNGMLTASASLVTNNSIGAAIDANNGEEVACAQMCIGDTLFLLNNRNANFAGGIPPPSSGLPGDTPPDCTCPSIDFTPDWCE
jgi:hypothetical protein